MVARTLLKYAYCSFKKELKGQNYAATKTKCLGQPEKDNAPVLLAHSHSPPAYFGLSRSVVIEGINLKSDRPMSE